MNKRPRSGQRLDDSHHIWWFGQFQRSRRTTVHPRCVRVAAREVLADFSDEGFLAGDVCKNNSCFVVVRVKNLDDTSRGGFMARSPSRTSETSANALGTHEAGAIDSVSPFFHDLLAVAMLLEKRRCRAAPLARLGGQHHRATCKYCSAGRPWLGHWAYRVTIGTEAEAEFKIDSSSSGSGRCPW